MPHLTKRVVDAATGGKRQRFLWDDEVKGFGLLVLPSGVKSFVVQYRNADSRSRRMTLGRYGTFTVDQARKAAQEAIVAVAKGGDPVHDRKARRAAPDVDALLERYLRDHVEVHNAETTRAEIKRLVERNIRPQIGHLKTGAVTTSDIARLHASMAPTPRQANFVLSIISKAFNLAELWHLRPPHSNPTRGIKRYEETERDRFLDRGELERLGSVIALAQKEGLPWIVKDADSKHLPSNYSELRSAPNQTAIVVILMLLFTGARLSEILSLEWKHFDPVAETLALPDRKGKDRKPHPVSKPVVTLIGALERSSDWLFPRSSDPERHISKEVVEATWQRIRHHANIEDVRLHDLRHTAGTIAGRFGNAFAVMHLLRHRNVVTTTRYVNAETDPIRDLSTSIGNVLLAGLSTGDSRADGGAGGGGNG